MKNINKDIKFVCSEKFNEYILEFFIHKTSPYMNITSELSGDGHYLSDFLSEYKVKDDVVEDILLVIKDVVDGNLLNEVISAECCFAYVENENTYFVDSYYLDSSTIKRIEKNSSMFISTADFKEITTLWLKFITSIDANNISFVS